MEQEQWNQVDQYYNDLFIPPDEALDSALLAASEAGLPAIQVAPNQGKLLWLLARAIGARAILEIGTLGAYSTIWLARALPPGGKLISLEASPKHAQVAQANLSRAGLDGIVEVRVGPAQDNLPVLAADGSDPFDLVFIDADKDSLPDYFTGALKLTRPGSLIIADNVVRGGDVADPSSRDSSVQGIRRFNEVVAAEPRVSAVALQTVGVKGYDGVAIALVNGGE